MILNVIKVLSVISFGSKCNKTPNSSRITVDCKLDEDAVTETCNGLIGCHSQAIHFLRHIEVFIDI